MSIEHENRDAEGIVDHVHFVRGLARALVSDAEAADDIAQDSLAVAMTTPGDRIRRGMQRWLSGVVRNHARVYLRSQKARRERESEAASRKLVDDTLRRAELRRSLVEHVMALPEPYRHTLLLRYMEEMTPRRIGEVLGRPVATVKTHLQRGLERLRERLDRDADGDRRSWQLAVIAMLAPVVPPVTTPPVTEPAATASVAAGASSVGLALKLTACVVLCVGVGAGAVTLGGDDESALAVAVTPSAADDELASPPRPMRRTRTGHDPDGIAIAARPAGRATVTTHDEVPRDTTAPMAPPPRPDRWFRVVDAGSGSPLPGAACRVNGFEAVISVLKPGETAWSLDLHAGARARDTLSRGVLETAVLFTHEPPRTTAPLRADRSGRVALTDVEPGGTLCVSHPGFVTRTVPWDVARGLPEEIALDPAAGLRLLRPQGLEEHVAVSLRNEESGDTRTATLRSGRPDVTLDDLPPGRWRLDAVVVPHPAADDAPPAAELAMRTCSRLLELDARKTEDVELFNGDGTRLHVDVVTNAPLDDLVLRLATRGPTTTPGATARAGAEEGFLFRDLAPGDYRLTVELPDGKTALHTRDVTLGDGETEHRLRLHLDTGALDVVAPATGGPWRITARKGHLVRHAPRDGRTRRLDHLEHGVWTLTATRGDTVLRRRVRVDSHNAPVHFSAADSRPVTVSLGAPRAWWALKDGDGRELASGRTAKESAVLRLALSAGDYVLDVAARGFAPTSVRLHVTDEPLETAVELKRPVAGRIECRTDGSPLTRASFRMQPVTGNTFAESTEFFTSDTGSASVRWLPGMVYRASTVAGETHFIAPPRGDLVLDLPPDEDE